MPEVASRDHGKGVLSLARLDEWHRQAAQLRGAAGLEGGLERIRLQEAAAEHEEQVARVCEAHKALLQPRDLHVWQRTLETVMPLGE